MAIKSFQRIEIAFDLKRLQMTICHSQICPAAPICYDHLIYERGILQQALFVELAYQGDLYVALG
ncbi:hypothetical protein WI98_10725 [Burkholderia vietnamiensis]|nr:hypothetical protein WI98_10725 [Burkholderia vietnamiensis]